MKAIAKLRYAARRAAIHLYNRHVEALNEWARNYSRENDLDRKIAFREQRRERLLAIPGDPRAERMLMIYLGTLAAGMALTIVWNLFGSPIPLETPWWIA